MPPATPPTAGPLPSTVLDQLARDIAQTHGGADHATLVRARPGPAGVEVGLCSLPPGVHPAEALLGQVVPPSWAASGVVAPARARSLAVPDDPGTTVTVVVLVGRDGHVTSHADGVTGLEAGGEAPIGRLPDLLLRTLGLPTPALGVPAAEWWRACWLDAVVAAAAADPAGRPDARRPVTGTLPRALVEALVGEPELCTAAGWGRIRQLAASTEEPPAPGPAAVRATVSSHVEPSVAAWMDDGCFGRWLLHALPSVDELLELAAGLVAPETLTLLRKVAQRTEPLDLDPAGPDHAPATGEPAPQGARGGTDGRG